jgi:hypothetical protein
MSSLDDRLSQLITEHGLEPHSGTILTAVRPAIDIMTSWDKTPSVGSSRFGGVPDLPSQMKWPYLSDLRKAVSITSRRTQGRWLGEAG